VTTRLSAEVSRYKLAAMLQVYMVFCGALFLAIGSGVNSYWNDIVSLPPSAAAFLGALAGAGGGLLAIILGALINAELNRLRDDRRRREETAALLKALASEMKVISISAKSNTEFLRAVEKEIPIASIRFIEPAKASVFEANADKIGWFPDQPRDKIYFAMLTREQVLLSVRAIVSTAKADNISEKNCGRLGNIFEKLAGAADEAVEALRKELAPAS